MNDAHKAAIMYEPLTTYTGTNPLTLRTVQSIIGSVHALGEKPEEELEKEEENK